MSPAKALGEITLLVSPKTLSQAEAAQALSTKPSVCLISPTPSVRPRPLSPAATAKVPLS